jgi:hypothetical protein
MMRVNSHEGSGQWAVAKFFPIVFSHCMSVSVTVISTENPTTSVRHDAK